MRSESSKAIVDVRGLSVKYASRDNFSVKNISFSIKKGEFVWLAGNSASGKSTLMNCLSGFIPHIIPAEVNGKIIFRGRDDMSPLQLSRHITMVHQDPETQFCTENVEDEIAFGLENRKLSGRKMDKRIQTTLEDLNCSELRHRKLHTLSGGEKQKVAIASMLALNPEVLILDEPTSNLDPKSMNDVLTAIENVSRKSEELTIILAEHRIGGLVDQLDRVLKLDNGKISKDILDFQSLNSDEKTKLSDYSYPDYQRKVKPAGKTILRLEKISMTLGGNKILKNISLQVKAGEIVAIMGRNGSGKTTLVKAISGLLEVQKGKVHISDMVMESSNKIPPYKVGEKIGFVFQNPNHQIFENTLKEEMLFGPKNFSKGIAKGKRKLQRMTSQENLDETTHPHTLSFGQKRRLNIYSSSLHDPDIMIIDEPFSGQDHQNALMIADIMDDYWKKGKTLLVVTHDIDFAKRFCTRAIVLKRGKTVYDGVPNKLKEVV